MFAPWTDKLLLDAGKSFSPKSLSGLVAWYRGDVATLNGSNVSSLTDQSSSGFDLTQGTAGQQPAYLTGGAGGQPYIRPDGSNDVLLNSSNVWPSGDLTFWLVLKTISTKTGEYLSNYTAGGDSRFHWYGGTETAFQRFSTGPSKTLTSATISILIYTATGTGAGSVETLSLNGDADTTVNNARPAAGGRDISLFGVGATPLLPRSYDFYELGILNVVASAANKTNLVNYAKARYSIA